MQSCGLGWPFFLEGGDYLSNFVVDDEHDDGYLSINGFFRLVVSRMLWLSDSDR